MYFSQSKNRTHSFKNIFSLCNLPCKGVQDVIASSQVPANLAQLQALELRSEAAAAKRNLHDNDETASDDIKVVILLEFQSIAQKKQN